MTRIDGLSLTEAERAIEEAHEGVHVWHSRDGEALGREYATVIKDDGSSETLDAVSVHRIEEVISRWEWEHGRAPGRAA